MSDLSQPSIAKKIKGGQEIAERENAPRVSGRHVCRTDCLDLGVDQQKLAEEEHREGRQPVSGTGQGRRQDRYHLSDLCNRVGVVTDEGCLERYYRSSANWTCGRETAVGNPGDFTCTVRGGCRFEHVPATSHYPDTTITVPYPDASNLSNCHGRYVNGDC